MKPTKVFDSFIDPVEIIRGERKKRNQVFIDDVNKMVCGVDVQTVLITQQKNKSQLFGEKQIRAMTALIAKTHLRRSMEK